MRIISLILGIVVTLSVTIAAVASMVVPRATRRGLAHLVTAGVMGVLRLPLKVLRSYRAQDRWLRLAAPISVLAQLAVFVFLVIVGIGLIIYGQFDLTWKQAAWQAAATVTTLGTSEAVNWSSAMTAAVGAFLGLVIIAVFMGYLVGLYSAYVSRESLMARFAQVGGEPAWGPMVLARSARLSGRINDAVACDEWITWMTDVRLGQQASPVLAHFRSPDPLRHWTLTLLAMLDATALALVLDEVEDRAAAIRVVAEGSVMLAVLRTQDLSAEWTNWKLEGRTLDILESASDPEVVDPTLTDEEWNSAAQLLTSSKAIERDKFDRARARFEAIRTMYAPNACELAAFFHAVRAPWSGNRALDLSVDLPDCSIASLDGSK